MQDSEFIPQRELILAGVGIAVALVLWAVLSILQKLRRRGEGEERLAKLSFERGGAADAPAGTTPFFVACYRGNDARFFRVYVAAGELLFLYAGQYFAMIDPDSPRGGERHWLVRSAKMLYTALGGLAVAAAIGMGAVIRGVVRNAAENPDGARDIFLIVLGCFAFAAVIIVVAVPLVLWTITRRGLALDAKSLAELREEAELHPKSFRATPDTVAELTITHLDQRNDFIPSNEVGSVLKFKHGPTGRWKIETFTTRDTRESINACLAVWGPLHVDIDPALTDRLATAARFA